jgi:cytochrome c6
MRIDPVNYIIFLSGTGLLLLSTGSVASGTNDFSIYQQNCAVCHQENGEGLVPVYPSLVNNTFVNGDPARVVELILRGRGAMPAFRAAMSAGEIGELVSLVRQSWGNNSASVEVELVEKIMSQLDTEKSSGREI